MFDTMTITKVVGAVCGSLLVFLLGTWAGSIIYSGGGGHGGEHAQQGYLIEVSSGGAAQNAADEEVNFEELLAAADAGKGEKVFKKCKACHKLGDGENGVGPHLYGVVNREVASVGGFGYSAPMNDHGGTWDAEALQTFLENPKGVVPGTKMGFAGLKKAQDRANLIAYLSTIGG